MAKNSLDLQFDNAQCPYSSHAKLLVCWALGNFCPCCQNAVDFICVKRCCPASAQTKLSQVLCPGSSTAAALTSCYTSQLPWVRGCLRCARNDTPFRTFSAHLPKHKHTLRTRGNSTSTALFDSPLRDWQTCLFRSQFALLGFYFIFSCAFQFSVRARTR